LENVDKVKVDFDTKKAVITMKKGALKKDVVAAAFKGSRYSLASFKQVVRHPKKYSIIISGMT